MTPNYGQDPIPTYHQPEGREQGYAKNQDHEGGNGQYVVNRGPFSTGWEVTTGLALQDEPFYFQIPPQITQEGNNNQ